MAPLLVQIIAIEDERLIFGVEDSAKGLCRLSFLGDVIDVRDVEVACANQVTNVTVVGEELLVQVQQAFFFVERGGQVVNLRFECSRPQEHLLRRRLIVGAGFRA